VDVGTAAWLFVGKSHLPAVIPTILMTDAVVSDVEKQHITPQVQRNWATSRHMLVHNQQLLQASLRLAAHLPVCRHQQNGLGFAWQLLRH
jgi:hypothetical protein